MKDKFVKDAVKAFSSVASGREGQLVIDERTSCMCGRMVKLTDLTTIDTGVFRAINTVCKGCKKGAEEDKKLARFVCVKCRTVIGHVKPSKDNTGFELKAGHTYHIEGCDRCFPGRTEFKLLEKVLWNRKLSNH